MRIRRVLYASDRVFVCVCVCPCVFVNHSVFVSVAVNVGFMEIKVEQIINDFID